MPCLAMVITVKRISTFLKGTLFMATQTAVRDTAITPTQALLVDQVGNEVYSSHYAERKLSRFIIGTQSVLLLGAFGLIFSLAHRPIANRYIRIDEMGRAQAIQYTDLNYSPREGEVRTWRRGTERRKPPLPPS